VKKTPAPAVKPRTRKPVPPTEEELSAATKAELLGYIETFGLDVDPAGKRVAELRDDLMELFYPSPDDEEPEDPEDDEDEDETPAPVARKKPAASKSRKADDDEEPDWEELLNQLNTAGGEVQFLKDGRTQLKLVLEDPDNKRSFYTESTRVYRGERRSKFLIRAIMVKLDPPAVKAVSVGKGVLKAIFQLLVEGYDLFDPEEGHGLTIVKRGSGLETSYNVMPSPKPVPSPDFVDLDGTLEEIAERLEESDVNRSDKSDDDDEDEKPRRRGPAKKAPAGKRRSSRDDDDDDEDDESW